MSHRRVLLVDDDPDLRESLADLLRDEGYEVLTAVNGKEALDQLARDRQVCVIVLDIMMPVMDGIEFRRRQRADPDLSAIPVVVITARGKGSDLDADAVHYKPIDLDRFLSDLSRYC